MGIKLVSTKTYTHSIGLSCCFRQWRAKSHCRFLHGYALQVELVFEATKLSPEGWVMDYGGLKPIKAWLEDMYDHKTLVALDDPRVADFERLNKWGIIQLRLVKATGCEAFAEDILICCSNIVQELTDGRVALQCASVREHESNAAMAIRTGERP